MAKEPTYAGPTSDELFRMGKKQLKELAAGRSKKAQAAQAELQRRQENKPYKAAIKAQKAA